ncbi:MAG TPA: hypothetical protein VNR11_15330 [Xanthobacteraceae bacterium]|nr:hypothetical protein [Xanthobacteraceae bacterium]
MDIPTAVTHAIAAARSSTLNLGIVSLLTARDVSRRLKAAARL